MKRRQQHGTGPNGLGKQVNRMSVSEDAEGCCGEVEAATSGDDRQCGISISSSSKWINLATYLRSAAWGDKELERGGTNSWQQPSGAVEC